MSVVIRSPHRDRNRAGMYVRAGHVAGTIRAQGSEDGKWCGMSSHDTTLTVWAFDEETR